MPRALEKFNQKAKALQHTPLKGGNSDHSSVTKQKNPRAKPHFYNFKQESTRLSDKFDKSSTAVSIRLDRLTIPGNIGSSILEDARGRRNLKARTFLLRVRLFLEHRHNRQQLAGDCLTAWRLATKNARLCKRKGALLLGNALSQALGNRVAASLGRLEERKTAATRLLLMSRALERAVIRRKRKVFEFVLKTSAFHRILKPIKEIRGLFHGLLGDFRRYSR